MLDELALMEAQQEVHDLIAQQRPLEETLEAITAWVGCLLPDALVSIMLYDPERRTLSMMPTPHFSKEYIQSLQGLGIGDGVGTCGTAASRRQLTITEDIHTDARWDLGALRDIARRENLRACWSTPILTREGQLLGTFAIYYRHPSSPLLASQLTLKRAVSLAALAIIRDRDSQEHRRLAAWHDSLFANHPDGVYEFDLEGRFQRSNAALTRITGYPEADLVGRHFNEFVEPDYWEVTQAGFDAARQGGSQQYETLGTHRDGHAYHLEVINFPVTIDGEVVGVYGICRDITERKRQEAARHLLKRGIEATPNPDIAPEMEKAAENRL